jgi:hypothetical protein
MTVSTAVRTYYAERIFARTTRTSPPPNFRPLERPHTGRAVVEGCRGGGKNILEVHLVATDDAVADLRATCGLCNPAMLVAADIVVDWARGRRLDEILAPDPLDEADLAPFFERLGDDPDDAREKFQYAVLAVQSAVRDHRGEPQPPLPRIAEPEERNRGDPDDDQLADES